MAKRHTINISVLADTRRFSSAFKNLSRETGLDRLGSAFRNFGSRMVGVLKDGIKYAALLATALAGIALHGGLKRALDTEDAALLMKQLGMSTKEVDDALKAVDRTFDGTPFANPDGFNFASQLRMSGKGLDQIERDLRNTSNVTALTLDRDFSRISEMFLKMAANGRVTATDLNSISLAGFPIRTVLADALSVSADELNRMVSSGKLTYDMLQEVLDGVEVLDGAAQNLGDSTRVSFSNMRTAFASIGERFLTPLLPVFRDIFQTIREGARSLRAPAEAAGQALATWLGDVAAPAAARLGRVFSGVLWPALTSVWAILSPAFLTAWTTIATALDEAGIGSGVLGASLSTNLQPTLETIAQIVADLIVGFADFTAWLIDNRDVVISVAAGIGGATAAFLVWNRVLGIVRAAVILLNAALALNPFILIAAAVATATAGLVYFFTQTETGRRTWETVWSTIQTVATTVIAALTGAFESLRPGLETVGGLFASIAGAIADTLWPAIQGLVDEVSSKAVPLWESFTRVMQPVIEGILAFAMALADQLWPILLTVGEFLGGVLLDALAGLINGFTDTIGGIMDILTGLLDFLYSVFTGDWSGAWDAVAAIFSGTFQAIWGVIQVLWHGTILKAVGVGLKLVRSLFSSAWGFLRSITSTVWSAIRNAIMTPLNAIRSLVSTVTGSVRSSISTAWSTVRTITTTMWNGVRNAVSNGIGRILNLAKGLPGRIIRAIPNAGRALFDLGKNLIQGLLNGVANLAGTIGSWFLNKVPGWIRGPLKRALGISSPSKEFAGYGKNLAEGLIIGLSTMSGQVQRASAGLAGAVTDGWEDPELSATVKARPGAHAATHSGTTGGVTYEIHMHTLMPTADAARQIVDAIKTLEREGGRIWQPA